LRDRLRAGELDDLQLRNPLPTATHRRCPPSVVDVPNVPPRRNQQAATPRRYAAATCRAHQPGAGTPNTAATNAATAPPSSTSTPPTPPPPPPPATPRSAAPPAPRHAETSHRGGNTTGRPVPGRVPPPAGGPSAVGGVCGTCSSGRSADPAGRAVTT